MFATPQRLANKDTWAAGKRAQRIWRDVRVLDADDLSAWLEMYPAVAQWLAVKIGRRPKGLRNLEEEWAEWIRATKTPLTAEIILTDRDDDAVAVLKWAKGPPALMPIQADSPAEAVAFFYAAIGSLPETHLLSYLSRCVLATDNETARDLVGIGSPLYIVLTDPDPGLAQRLVDDGHHVYAAVGSDTTVLTPARRLARPWAHGLRIALVRAGLSEQDAHQLARAAGRSITVLRRIMPAALAYKPAWAITAPPELLAAMLAGAWDETSGVDKEVVGALAGCAYAQVEATLAPMTAMVGGPLMRSGSIWKIVSLRDLWVLIAPQLTTSLLDRFETAFHQVLRTVDPRFEAARKSTWFEKGEFGEEASPALRRGLSQAMIALGVYPTAAKGIADAGRRADHAISRLLSAADARLWWSLSRDFQRLAEASPSAFLDAVDAALDGNDPPIMSLFRSDEGLLARTEYLSDLLWAIEMLARSPELLMRSALLLARLDEIDPGGTWGNRPAASLRQIFVSWSPQTYAVLDERLKVIDAIVRRHPSVGWKLLIALAPRPYDSSQPSPQPDWRDFTTDREEKITWATIWQTGREIGKRLLAQAGEDGARWRALLELWSNFEPAWRVDAAQRLNSCARSLVHPTEREALRDALRGLLQKHRNFADAQWAMKEDDLAPLEAIFQDLQPTSASERHRWLFRTGPDFFRPNTSYQEILAEVDAKQTVAATELLRSLSIDELFVFARTVRLHRELGRAIAKANVGDEVKDAILKTGLLAEDRAEADLGLGVLFTLAPIRGNAWLDELWKQAIRDTWGENGQSVA